MKQYGQWHGPKYYFGLHYDLHAGENDTELGLRCGERELAPMLRLMNPDFVQTDCKGHPGYTSWFSRTPDASVPPKLKKDALKQWRAATKKLGLPLHCHYSGIWDRAAAAKHPEWRVAPAKRKPAGATRGQNAGAPFVEKMCPRSPYLEHLMIPQLLELIDRYGVDGFWIDGDVWAVEPCYCERCREAFTKSTGIAEPPVDAEDPNWPTWWNFTRESFETYVTRYCDAVHARKKGVLVCSNWLQTFRNPGEPTVPTDWISGDNAWVWGLDASRCEARFLSTRRKPWDIMLWAFYRSGDMHDGASPWSFKPSHMLMQEAAVLLSFGGGVQIYENGGGLRDGRLAPWRMKQLGEVGRFIKKRRALCQGTETIPQIAVLHSECHARRTVRGPNLMHAVDVAPVQGAVFALLENHYGVDVLDEWALLPRLSEFPLVAAPEQAKMSEEMVAALKEYVRGGGRLLVTGTDSFDRFGPAFLGVSKGRIVENAAYHVPAASGSVPLFSARWRLVRPSQAKSLAPLGRSPLLDDELLPNPAATLNRFGRGRVAYVPADILRDFNRNRCPLTRSFVGEIVRALWSRRDFQCDAPACVDVVLRRKGGKKIIHLVNRSSGIPNAPNNGVVDEMPRVGPVRIVVRSPQRPRRVTLAFEKGDLSWKWASGRLTVSLATAHIHVAVVVE